MNVLSIVGAIILAWLLSYVYVIYRNYIDARRSGFPLILTPLDPDNTVYVVIKNHLRLLYERYLPKALYDRLHLTTYGWEFRTKWEVHSKMGPVFIHVTAGNNEVWIADPELASIVTSRRKDFLVLPITKTIMGILGSNLLISNGEDWARQRRIVAPNLNERISETVWKESFKQAGAMAEYFVENAQRGTKKTIPALRVIAVNVLGQAGYGQSKAWSTDLKVSSSIDRLSYFEAIALIVDYIVPAAVMPIRLMRLPFMPKVMHKVALALEEAPIRANEMLEEERMNLKAAAEAKNNMMSMLVRLGEQEASKEKDSAGSVGSQHLSEDEIRGNLFIFSAAGFDTTANTMAYAVTMLAIYPQWQDWLMEELDQVLGNLDNEKDPDYNATFPQLKRCLAVMYETLRHFPPVVHLARGTDRPQTITTSKGKTYHIAANTKVYVNNPSLGSNPSIWGPDALEFKPTKWLSKDPETGEEVLVAPPRGCFMPWSAGPRICPGQKMSQVEFTAVFTKLFRTCRVEPTRREGESLEEARQRLIQLTQESQPRLTLQINNPDDLELTWTRR